MALEKDILNVFILLLKVNIKYDIIFEIPAIPSLTSCVLLPINKGLIH